MTGVWRELSEEFLEDNYAESEGAELGLKHAKIMAEAIVSVLPPLRSETLLAVLIEAKEEIEHVIENDARNNDLYAGCPRQQRLVQKLQDEIKKVSK